MLAMHCEKKGVLMGARCILLAAKFKHLIGIAQQLHRHRALCVTVSRGRRQTKTPLGHAMAQGGVVVSNNVV
jgi:hypothetical protein